jgi:hypothetical protein
MAPKKRINPKHKFETVDFWGNPVHCTIQNWEGHIVEPLDGHPELTGREREVAQAIADPEIIRPSTRTGNAFAFERVTTNDIIRAIVYYANGTAAQTGNSYGQLGTAYLDDPAWNSRVGAPIYTKPASNAPTVAVKKKGGGS